MQKCIDDNKLKLDVEIECNNVINLNQDEFNFLKTDELELYPTVKINTDLKETNIHDSKALIKLKCDIIIKKKIVEKKKEWSFWSLVYNV